MRDEVRPGLTGLATLAFLGAGHTEKTGKYKNNVRLAVQWMVKNQNNDGSIGNNRGGHGVGAGYNHAIAGLALAEAYGMAKVHSTGIAAQRAIDYSVEGHQREYGGWRYNPKSAGDLSVTGWYVMQMKSGKVAGLKIPGQTWQGAAAFLDKVEKKDAEVEGYEGLRAGVPEHPDDFCFSRD